MLAWRQAWDVGGVTAIQSGPSSTTAPTLRSSVAMAAMRSVSFTRQLAMLRPSVEASIADQRKASLASGPTLGFHEDFGRFCGGQLNQRENIAERAQGFLGIERSLANHLGIQPHPGELDEILVVRQRQIESEGVSHFDDVPSGSEVALRDADFLREHIHRAERQDSHSGTRTRDAVDDFVDRSITTSCDDVFKPLRHGFLGDPAGIASFGSCSQDRFRSQFTNPFGESRGFLAAGGRIEDNDRLIHTSLSHGKP